MGQQIYQHRGGLLKTRQALKAGAVTIGFIGGSITDERPGCSWPEPVIGWLCECFPDVKFTIENAAIGATESDLGVLRAERDLINRHCDLVFVEYAVNDYAHPAEKRNRTREGLLRKLLKASFDVVVVYTYCQDMYKDMYAGGIPASIAEFEVIANHYNIGSIWMGLYAFEEIKRGHMKWADWLPDGLHPQSRGSLSYGQSVIGFLKKELLADPSTVKILSGENLPAPLNVLNWEYSYVLPLSAVSFKGPWSIRRWPNMVWIDQVLQTTAIGATLSFGFNGRGVALAFDFGRMSAEYRYRIDKGEWKTEVRERPSWVGPAGWLRISNHGDELPPAAHLFELEVTHGDRPDCTGTNFVLALIGVIP